MLVKDSKLEPINFLVGLVRRVCLGLSPCLFALSALAQDNYEIQVYGSETVPTGKTMVELHSNYTIMPISERSVISTMHTSSSISFFQRST